MYKVYVCLYLLYACKSRYLYLKTSIRLFSIAFHYLPTVITVILKPMLLKYVLNAIIRVNAIFFWLVFVVSNEFSYFYSQINYSIEGEYNEKKFSLKNIAK